MINSILFSECFNKVNSFSESNFMFEIKMRVPKGSQSVVKLIYQKLKFLLKWNLLNRLFVFLRINIRLSIGKYWQPVFL